MALITDLEPREVAIGQLAPTFTLPLPDGRTKTLQDLRGQTTILVLHSGGWDPTRERQLSLINSVLAGLPSNVQAFHVTRNGLRCNMDLGLHGTLEFPLVEGESSGEIGRLFGVEGKQAIYVIDHEGIVQWSHVGPIGAQTTLDQFAESIVPAKGKNVTRREFLVTAVAVSLALSFLPSIARAKAAVPKKAGQLESFHLNVNGKDHALEIEPNVTLLDALRERIGLTGTKKGCDHGQCGACTVHVDGRRVNSCLLLAIMQDGKKITTIEGIAKGSSLHPMQEAFIKHDGFQCGFCTSGQIMSAIACVEEGHAGSEADIKAWMSGNICRCGAYIGIRDAIMEARVAKA